MSKLKCTIIKSQLGYYIRIDWLRLIIRLRVIKWKNNLKLIIIKYLITLDKTSWIREVESLNAKWNEA